MTKETISPNGIKRGLLPYEQLIDVINPSDVILAQGVPSALETPVIPRTPKADNRQETSGERRKIKDSFLGRVRNREMERARKGSLAGLDTRQARNIADNNAAYSGELFR